MINPRQLVLALFSLCSVFSNYYAEAQVQGPAFDCARAVKPDEIAICGDPRLSALDRVADAAYHEVRRTAGPATANAIGRRFLALRAICGADKLCILRQYVAIIRAYHDHGSSIEFPSWIFTGDPTTADPPPSSAPAPALTAPPPPPLIAAPEVPQPAPATHPAHAPATAETEPSRAAPPMPAPAPPSPHTDISPMGAATPSLSVSSSDSKGLSIIVVALLALTIFIGIALKRRTDRTSARAAVLRTIGAQSEVLARKRDQLKRRDDYGIVQTTAWEKEKKYFISTALPAHLSASGRSQEYLIEFLQNGAFLDAAIEGAADAAPKPSWNNVINLADVATGEAYEKFCARILEQNGWAARLTKGSGDQGVDIVAEGFGRRVVIQCKFYTLPVGNDAVQQAVAARLHERADAAAVVSNAQYTRSARQLSTSTKVLLLHHDDLANLRDRLMLVG